MTFLSVTIQMNVTELYVSVYGALQGGFNFWASEWNPKVNNSQNSNKTIERYIPILQCIKLFKMVVESAVEMA